MMDSYLNLNELLKACSIEEDEVYKSNKLEIPFRNVSLECCKEIVNKFPDLRYLDINTGQMDDDYALVLSKLTDLESLDISANRITNTGVKYLSNLSKMKTLDLSLCDIDDNCLDDIIKMRNLQTLHLSGTKISIFGITKLKSLPELASVDLKRSDCANSLTNELLKGRKIQDVFKYIENKMNQDVPVGNFRLVLLGEPASGKTSLFNQLCGFEYYRRTSTLGINIRPFQPKNEYAELINYPFNIWDFGGQLTQNSVHNAFISENCIFAITIEPRMNDCERNFIRWYRNIQSYVQKLPIIVIFTKCDNENGGIGNSIDYEEIIENVKNRILEELNIELSEQTIKERPRIEFVKSSSMVEGGLNDFLKVLNNVIYTANQNPIFKVTRIQKQLLNQIVSLDKEIFSDIDVIKKIYDELCDKENIPRKRVGQELKSLMKYGDIFFDGDLATKGILKNPQLLSDIIYEIIVGNSNGVNNEISFEDFLKKEGTYNLPYAMSANDVTKYFKLDSVKNTGNRVADTLINFLVSRKYIFRSAIDTDMLYIPSKFPSRWKKNIAEEFDYDNSVRHFKYQLKPSVNGISWMILSDLVNVSKEIYNQDGSEINIEDQDRIYSDGFILDFKEEKAVIKENLRDNSLELWITREIPDLRTRKLLDLIFESFSKIINLLNYSKDSYTILCVCPCCGRWQKECVRTHKYSKILSNKESIRCSESNLMITREAFLKNSEDHLNYVNRNKKEKAFVITPFSINGEKIYDAISKKIVEAYEHTISDKIEKPYICLNPNQSTTIDEDIRKYIEDSRVIVTILENSKPNVYFEYGYARSFRNKVFITFYNEDNVNDLPFDVRNYSTIPMDYDDLDKFKEDLQQKFLEIRDKF